MLWPCLIFHQRIITIHFRMKTPILNMFFTCLLAVAGVSSGVTLAEQDGRGDGGDKAGGDKARGKNSRSAEKREAGERSDRGPRDGGKQGDRFKAFKAVDADKDGSITFDEFSTMSRLKNMDEAKRRKLFDFLDRDKDGKLQLRELQPPEPRWIIAIRKDFNKLDVNDDGGVDMAEFSKLAQFKDKDKTLLVKFFEKLDRDKSKSIEKSELKSTAGHHPRPHFDFSNYDLNSSGGLDFDEYSKMPWMGKCPEDRREKLFKRVDVDENGEISPEEVRSAHRMHKPPSHGKSGKPRRGARPPERDGESRKKPNGKTRQEGTDRPVNGNTPPTPPND